MRDIAYHGTTSKRGHHDSQNANGTRRPARRVFDLFDAGEATELSMRAELLRGLQAWVSEAGIQAKAAKKLGITQSRVSNIARGTIGNFSLDLLVRLAARAGLRPQLKLAA